MALVTEKTSNDFILGVCDSHLNPDIKNAIYWRLKKGEEQYGHKLRPLDDTTQWGTKKNSWKEMAEEEIADAIIYVLTNHVRSVEQNTVTEVSYQLTMHIVKQLSELHHLMKLIEPE